MATKNGGPSFANDEKVFNDPIHGSIRLHPLLVKIIDTPQFQRLRNIKQMGGKYFIYPGASHNRFEHSIGVAHLAGKLVEKLKDQQEREEEQKRAKYPQTRQKEPPSYLIDSKDMLCVKIAGLCHDLGHGPFSHVWDDSIVPKMNPDKKKWKHEDGSIKMFRYLKGKYLENEFEKYHLDEKDTTFVEELIKPKKTVERKETGQLKKLRWKHKGRKEDKSFLYEIVSNKRNGIDVDKWDYFKRDCHYLGLTCVFDIDRAMEFARVLKPKRQRRQICYRDKEARNIFQMFQTRELLHRQACLHKTALVVEDMIAEALYLADESGFKIPIGKVDKKKGEIVEEKISAFTDDPIDGPDPEMYTHLTDHVFQMILGAADASSDSDMGKAKKLLLRIQERKLYKYLGEVPLNNHDTIEEEEIEVTKKIKDHFKEKVPKKHLFINKATFNFGKKNENPFHFIMFYSKPRGDDIPEPKNIPLSEVSSFLPESFQETFLRVYYKDPDCTCTDDELQDFKSHFNEWATQYKEKWELDNLKEKKKKTEEKLAEFSRADTRSGKKRRNAATKQTPSPKKPKLSK